MNMMKKFTTFTVCAAIVPALTLGAVSIAQTQTGTGMQGTEQGTGDMNQGAGTMNQSNNQNRTMGEEFFSTKPVGALYADDVIGKTIKHRSSDEDVGEIQDLVIGEDGRIVGVLVKTGGFLGLGGQDVNLGWDHLSHTMEDGEYEFYTEITEDSLRGAPKYSRK